MVGRLERVPERPVAVALGTVIAAFGVLGAWQVHASRWAMDGWHGAIHVGAVVLPDLNLDRETNLPTAFSALVLAAAAATAWTVAARVRVLGIRPAVVRGVAVALGIMALDEVFQFHERLEAATGVDWQLLYVPVFAVAGILGVALLVRLHDHRDVRARLVAGATAWVVAQVIEFAQWDGNRLVAPWSTVPEEILEMAGSLCFLLAFLALARATARVTGATAPSPAPAAASPRVVLGPRVPNPSPGLRIAGRPNAGGGTGH